MEGVLEYRADLKDYGKSKRRRAASWLHELTGSGTRPPCTARSSPYWR